MGLARVSAELKRARGTMSQKEAAAHWQVPYSTLCALEQQVERNYQSHTLAQFDVMLGRSTWDLYDQPDEAGWDVPAATAAAVEELQAQVAEHARDSTSSLPGSPSWRTRSPLEQLLDSLDRDELAAVEAYVHFVFARRHGNAGY